MDSPAQAEHSNSVREKFVEGQAKLSTNGLLIINCTLLLEHRSI